MYDAWDETYKKPFGAVEEKKAVEWTVRAPGAMQVSAVRLRIAPDGCPPLFADMQRVPEEKTEDSRFYCSYALAARGLYWYNFELATPSGIRYLIPDESGRGVAAGDLRASWQLTVYRAGFTTPDWIKGGVIYQIFPDRFAKEGDFPDPLPEGRYLRGDWGGIPEYRGDEEGKYLNNTYFGGNLKGILKKIPYLRSLGVTALYLNPIFEAHSNHRYNAADYRKIDPMLGTEEDFRLLCRKMKEAGIRVILDGVFNHTGDDSVYFNRRGRYPEPGAFQSASSAYFSWYRFQEWPEKYSCWWGYKTLPTLDKENPSYLRFVAGPDGVLEHWINAGASGFRLDVADELPSAFIRALRQKLKECGEDALLLGEVWEDASNKISYSERRPYLNGDELDGVMNYPFRSAVLSFLKGSGAQAFRNAVMTILEHYPKPCVDVMMNLLGTHDTARALTELAGEPAQGRDRVWKAGRCLTAEQRRSGVRRLKLAAVLQFFLPGVPCIYYGDEAGMEGYDDPFNRGCFPWGKEDRSLLSFYQELGDIRKKSPVLRQGEFRILCAQEGLFAFERFSSGQGLICAVNAGENGVPFDLPPGYRLLAGGYERREGRAVIPACSFAVFSKAAVAQ